MFYQRSLHVGGSIVALLAAFMLACGGSSSSGPSAQSVKQLDIAGMVAPVVGAAPVPSITATDQYTGTVTWTPTPAGGKFQHATSYTATIALMAKSGWTFNGVAANAFKVLGVPSGATVSNSANSGEVKVVFPATLSFSLTLAQVPVGQFQRYGYDEDISILTIPYRMGIHEITRAQFKEVMGSDPSDVEVSSGMNDPVQNVNWYHALAFCNKLSIREGLQPVYSVKIAGVEVNWAQLRFADIPTDWNADWNAAQDDWDAAAKQRTKNGYRLPTEMEWIWAAMGADQDSQPDPVVDGVNIYGWTKPFAGFKDASTVIGDYAVFGYYGSDEGRTLNRRSNPVGTKLANELGLFDMSGNVREWVWDRLADYPDGSLTDYRGGGPEDGATRLECGGSWYNSAALAKLMPIPREPDGPASQSAYRGFRVVRK